MLNLDQAPQRILCLDYGTRFIGMAVADFPGITARALDTLQTDRQNIGAELERVVRGELVTRIVIGFPFSDVEGEIHKRIRVFSGQVQQWFPALPIDFADESYSSIEADDLVAETGIGRRKKKRNQDSQAAKLVLLRYLGLRP
jgi:putative holliday junction resolvase